MAYELIITESAERDLDEIITYIAEKLSNPQAASDFVAALEKHYDILEQQPLMFERLPDEYQVRDYHRFPLKNYIVIYRIDAIRQEVILMRIFYGGRDYQKYLS